MNTVLLFIDGVANGCAILAAIGVVILLVRQGRLAEQVKAASRVRSGRVTTKTRGEGVKMVHVGDRWYRPTDRVTDAPMIDGYTLRDWLVYHHGQNVQPPPADGTVIPQGVWAEVVTEFYTRAAAVPAVADYFRNTNMDAQRNHFLRALDIVTSKGLTAGTIDFVRTKHAGITNSDGVPITGPIYDAVISTLIAVLAQAGVPQHGRAALAETIAPLRDVLVRA